MPIWSYILGRQDKDNADDKAQKTSAPEKNIDRAEFFRNGLRGLGHAAGTLADQVVSRVARPHLRPPGALDELAFLATCTRCGDCVTACPHDAILRLGPEARLASNTPFIDPERSPCLLCEDLPCVEACEVDALQTIRQEEIQLGIAVIQRETCLAWSGDFCDQCLRDCPFPGEAILADPGSGRVYVDMRRCVGCGQCVFACPTLPSSIKIERS